MGNNNSSGASTTADEDRRERVKKVFRTIFITFGIIILITVIIVFLIAYLLASILRPILCNSVMSFLFVLLPIIFEIAGYIIAFTGIGLPVTGILLVGGAIIETLSSVCDIVSGNVFSGVLGLLGTAPIIGLVPQSARAFSKIIGALRR